MSDWRAPSPAADTAAPALPDAPSAPPVWLITGCSSGLGRAAARAALAAGYRVAVTARDPRTLEDLVHPNGDSGNLLRLQLDLLDRSSITSAVEDAMNAFGRIDVLLNNAGTATLGAVEELTDDLLRTQLETNLVGPLAVVRAVLPSMRRQRSGRILQMSSMGGRVAFAGLGAYHASKFALEGASIALAQEVAPYDIRVTLVEPGDIRTPVLAPGRMAAAEPMAAYDATVGQARAAIAELNGNQPGDPDKVAAAMLAVALEPDPPLHLALGPDCHQQLTNLLDRQQAELGKWAHLTLSTDHHQPAVASPAAPMSPAGGAAAPDAGR